VIGVSVLAKGCLVVAAVAAVGYVTGAESALGGPGGRVPAGHDPQVIRVVYEVGRNHQVSDKVMLAAFEACVVESTCRNLPYGDRDSLGVFQQRPSQGWGSPAQVTDVRYAARQFFVRAVASEPRYRGRSAGRLAQSVQRSCCPGRYDQAQPTAHALLAKAARLNGATP
jgi:hypothetical protein